MIRMPAAAKAVACSSSSEKAVLFEPEILEEISLLANEAENLKRRMPSNICVPDGIRAEKRARLCRGVSPCPICDKKATVTPVVANNGIDAIIK